MLLIFFIDFKIFNCLQIFFNENAVYFKKYEIMSVVRIVRYNCFKMMKNMIGHIRRIVVDMKCRGTLVPPSIGICMLVCVFFV